jgi:sialate O-acetylesterase
MNALRARIVSLGCLVLTLSAAAAIAEVRLPSVLSAGMVLQRGTALPFWGWASPGEEVTVSIGGNTASAVAGSDGRWRLSLAPMTAGGSHTVVVQGENTLELDDVLVGEVWVASGQSNMKWPLRRTDDADLEALRADLPRMRLFTVPEVTTQERQDDTDARWQACTPAAALQFSAVAYYFGRRLHETLDVPVGVLFTAWGGTPAEAWTSREALEAEPKLEPLLRRWDETVASYDKDQAEQEHAGAVAAWEREAEQAKAEGRQPPRRPRLANPVTSAHRPAGLYNGMIAPLIPYAVRGAIWYQGESNASRAHQYRTIFPTMIRNWRHDWGRPDLSFYWVQLANFKASKEAPRDDEWAELREAQSLTLAEPHTGEAVIIDLGMASDIHPTNKRDVADRLARLALAHDYGYGISESGPRFTSMEPHGSAIELRFEHAGHGLVAYDAQPLQGFAIAGKDRKWVWADAEIVGPDRVSVRSAEVSEPVAVRYGWASNPVCNLYGGSGQPASPFRTDDWPGITVGQH